MSLVIRTQQKLFLLHRALRNAKTTRTIVIVHVIMRAVRTRRKKIATVAFPRVHKRFSSV